MKKLIMSMASIVFAGSVGAADESFIYHGFEVNNPDLYAGYKATDAATAVQPGIGDRWDSSRSQSMSTSDSYDIFVMNNPDSYSGDSRSDNVTSMRPEIGDSTGRTQQRSLIRHDSYDAWVAGNPDQESGF